MLRQVPHDEATPVEGLQMVKYVGVETNDADIKDEGVKRDVSALKEFKMRDKSKAKKATVANKQSKVKKSSSIKEKSEATGHPTIKKEPDNAEDMDEKAKKSNPFADFMGKPIKNVFITYDYPKNPKKPVTEAILAQQLCEQFHIDTELCTVKDRFENGETFDKKAFSAGEIAKPSLFLLHKIVGPV